MIKSISLALLAVTAVQLGQTDALPTNGHRMNERAPAPGIIAVGSSVAGYTSIGCYQDTYNTNAQILSVYQFQPLMTLQSCAAFCNKGGYTYMGVSNGQWCYCDNQINYRNGLGFQTTADNCYVPCFGDLSQNCGAFWTNSMFMVTSKYQAAQDAAASSSRASAASASASIFTATSLSASASAASALPSSLSASRVQSSLAASAAAASSVQASLAASAAAASSVQASLAASSSAAASLQASIAASASVAASVSASASAAASRSASASLAASISASASVAASLAASASLAGSIAASASVAQSLSASASLSQSLAASASVAQSLAASASAASSLSASASVASSIAASASVASSLSASASVASSVSAAAVAATTTPTPWVAAAAACIAEGTAGRALTGDSTTAPDMTYSKCLSYCGSKGFAIAGLEFSSECYCGNSLVNGASLSKTSGQCNMACSGSPSKTCGGPDALTVFVIPSKVTSLSSDLTAKAAQLPSGWSAASTACVAEGTNGRALTGAATAANNMTPAVCSSFCGARGFKYAGVEYGSECYCGNTFENGASLNTASTQCNMGCAGDINTMCGGPGALNVFTNPSIVPPVGSSDKPVVSGSLPSGWSAASPQCIQEVSGRALTGSSIAGSSMTISTCLSFCESGGFQYAGLEFGSECYCGSALVNGASLSQPSGQCNMPCAADSSSSCGGPNAIQLYSNPSLAKAAAPVVVVNGYSSSGCIQEVSGRALTGLRVDYTDMTIDKCTTACKNAGFKYAGVEYGQECYCGDSLVNGASTSLTSGQCYMDCPGNSLQKCGGPNAIQLYTAN